MYDSSAIAYLLAPEMFTAEETYLDVELAGSMTAGCTVVDLKGTYTKMRMQPYVWILTRMHSVNGLWTLYRSVFNQKRRKLKLLEVIISLVVVLAVVYLITKKYNATIALALGGIALLFAAAALGHPILSPEETTGIIWLDPFKKIELSFLSNLGNIGLTIMVLFGYSSYMNLIGANEVTVNIMTKPLGRIKSKYILIPIIFLLGNLLSLVVPSASSLAVLLMATLFPILTRIDVSPLAAGAVIATTATIMPTPLGADNVIAANTFGMNIMDYVIAHAKISIPALLLMAVAHYFWQKYLDKKDGTNAEIDKSKIAELNTNLPPAYYAILPILPLILVLVFNLALKGLNLNIGLVTITFISLIASIIVELIR